MSIQVLVVGTLLLIAGAGFALMGYRGFLAFLPVWGAVFGFVAGTGLVTMLAGDAILATPLDWIGGVVGVLACGGVAVVSWWGPIAVGAGSVGWIAGAGVVSLLGGAPGLLELLAAAAGGVLLAVIANVLETPRALVIVLSAVGGATAMGAGIALLLGWAPLDRLAWHTLGTVFSAGAPATVLTVTIAALAAAFQLTTTRDLDDEVQVEIARRRG
jgi:hypothetical protein